MWRLGRQTWIQNGKSYEHYLPNNSSNCYTSSMSMSNKFFDTALLKNFAFLTSPPPSVIRRWWSALIPCSVREGNPPRLARGLLRSLLVIRHHKQLWRPKAVTSLCDPDLFIHLCLFILLFIYVPRWLTYLSMYVRTTGSWQPVHVTQKFVISRQEYLGFKSVANWISRQKVNISLYLYLRNYDYLYWSPCNCCTWVLYRSSVVCRFALLSGPSKIIAKTHVFVGEFGLGQLQIWKEAFIVFPPLSPPSLTQISSGGMNPWVVNLLILKMIV